MVGNPKWYPFGNLEDKSYSAGQGLKEFLTRRGMVAVLQQPVMQVVDVSMMRLELKTFEMYHLILSDSVHTQDATLATHLNHLVKNTLLHKGTTVRLLEFMCNTSQRPSVIVVIQLEVLQTCGLIGSPKAYEPSLFGKPYVPESRYGLPYPRSVVNYAEPMNGPCSSSQGFKRHLSWGAVPALLGGELAAGQQPVLQVFGISTYKPDYRILLSDGVHWMNSVLLSSLRRLVDDNHICKGTIVRLLKFSSDTFENFSSFSGGATSFIYVACCLSCSRLIDIHSLK
uniref:Replication factor-A protein 1 N-terminal domain-containing protein n=1 Tax=Setaria italica TaxID=4555 RepID=K3YL37_SETIT